MSEHEEAFGAIVSIHGVRVGQIDRLGSSEDHVFAFDPAWLADPLRPCLGQLFEDRRPVPIHTSGLLCWFAHLLPQGPYARHLRRWAGIDEAAPDLALLIAMGSDLPGAVVLDPGHPRIHGSGGYAPRSSMPREALRFSLAGAQWKLSVRRGERGLVVPVRGEAGEYIAKFHDAAFAGLPRVECATTRWASLAGIAVPEVRLANLAEFAELPDGLPLGDDSVFLTKRFDRTAATRVHFEDLGQVLDRTPGEPGQYTGRYEELAALLSQLAPVDLEECLARIAFMIVCGNGDAHWKNWALSYPDRRSPRLAPAYDLVSTVVYPQIDRELALELGGVRAFAGITWDAFAGLVRASQRPEAWVHGCLRAARERALQVFVRAESWGYEREHIELLRAHHEATPWIREA